LVTNNDQPNFSELLRSEIREDLSRGFGRVIPWLAAGCAALGAAVAYFAEASLFVQAQWGTLASVYGGVVTFNGITLALGWTTIGRVYDTVSKADFSRFLRASGILNTYLFYISLVHIVQVTGAVAAVAGLVSVFLPLPAPADRVILGAVVATTLYAIRWAAGSARIVKDLSWHYSTFDELSPDERHKLYDVASRTAA
jgi:hypothetical protein